MSPVRVPSGFPGRQRGRVMPAGLRGSGCLSGHRRSGCLHSSFCFFSIPFPSVSFCWDCAEFPCVSSGASCHIPDPAAAVIFFIRSMQRACHFGPRACLPDKSPHSHLRKSLHISAGRPWRACPDSVPSRGCDPLRRDGPEVRGLTPEKGNHHPAGDSICTVPLLNAPGLS